MVGIPCNHSKDHRPVGVAHPRGNNRCDTGNASRVLGLIRFDAVPFVTFSFLSFIFRLLDSCDIWSAFAGWCCGVLFLSLSVPVTMYIDYGKQEPRQTNSQVQVWLVLEQRL